MTGQKLTFNDRNLHLIISYDTNKVQYVAKVHGMRDMYREYFLSYYTNDKTVFHCLFSIKN
jgi:hypothetical protein